MADTTYQYGENRVVYQATGFTTGLTVTARFWDSGLVEFEDSPFTLTELGDGLYYLEISFDRQIIYHGLFFEDSTPKRYHSFRIVAKLT